MMSKQIQRIFYTGILNVVRNPFVSLSAIFVMSITLFIVGFSFLIGKITDDSIDSLKDKVDVTVYFINNIEEPVILDFKTKIESLSIIDSVLYVSADAALAEYRKRHENDPEILEGLSILDENPFRARFSIKSKDPNNFEAITRFIQNEDLLSDNEKTIVDKIDYFQNRDIIERLSNIIGTAEYFSIIIIINFILIAFVIVFNLIRLVIYLSKDEIEVMRLIGADKLYVRGPFLVSGALYGLFSAIIACILLYPVVLGADTFIKNIFNNEGAVYYYYNNLVIILLLLSVVGVLIGVISSFLSTRRYINR